MTKTAGARLARRARDYGKEYAARAARREQMVAQGVPRAQASRISRGHARSGEATAREVRKLQRDRGESIGRAVRQINKAKKVEEVIGTHRGKRTEIKGAGPQVSVYTKSPTEVLKILRAFPDERITLLGTVTGHGKDAIPVAGRGETLTGQEILDRLAANMGYDDSDDLDPGELWDAIAEGGYGEFAGASVSGAYLVMGVG